MPLLRFKPTLDHVLIVSVDKSALTGEPNDKGTHEQINSAYGFQIDLFNIGNEPIVNPNIEICLDMSARIVEVETQPVPSSAYNIEIKKDKSKLNILNMIIPYINNGERIRVRLISTENENRECKVNVLGLGVQTRPRSRNRLYLTFVVSYSLTLLSLTAFLAFSLLAYFNASSINISFALFFGIAALVLAFIVLWVISKQNQERRRRLRRNQEWDWKETEPINKPNFLRRLLS